MWLLLIITVVTVVLYFKVKNAGTEEHPYKYTNGIVEKIVSDDSTDIMYKLTFEHDGIIETVLTCHYYDTKGKYHSGDPVRIKYYTEKKGNIVAQIDDDELITVADQVRSKAFAFLIAAIVSFTAFAVLLIMKVTGK